MKLLRLLLLILILGIAIYTGYFVYGVVFELLDFQIGAYKIVLQTGEQLGDVKDMAGGLLDQAMGLFGSEFPDAGVDKETLVSIEKKLSKFEGKLKLVSGIIGVIVGLLVWKILFDLVFGLSSIISKAKTFIN